MTDQELEKNKENLNFSQDGYGPEDPFEFAKKLEKITTWDDLERLFKF